jgi:hypothetical protein
MKQPLPQPHLLTSGHLYSVEPHGCEYVPDMSSRIGSSQTQAEGAINFRRRMAGGIGSMIQATE